MSEPVISRDDAIRHIHAMHGSTFLPSEDYIERARGILSEFLKGRVPPAKPEGPRSHLLYEGGFNACRDIVLQGRKG